ncbi:MAG: nucleotidyltransferase domain-containing protein [Bacillota bacterium]|jgi:predicted nucleotidyltransferase
MVRAADEVARVIEQFVQLVAEQVPLNKVIFYGSHARGNAREHSDINLVVISPAFGRHKLRDLRLLTGIAMECDDDITALPYGTSELQDLAPGTFLDEVLRTGKVVYPKE